MVLIVDSNSLYARSYYAAQKISAVPGNDQALRLALSSFISLLNPNTNGITRKFTHVLCCWDSQQNSAKNREPKPEDYHALRDIAKELFTLFFSANHAELAPYEGDDLVGSAAYKVPSNIPVYIASGDKDLMQLARANTYYLSLHEKCVLSTAYMCEKFHVKSPEQISLALAIQGDSVDCITGVKGWGPAKVKKLFKDIPKGMAYSDVMQALMAQMTPVQQDEFLNSLDRTLINTTLPTPEPAKIKFTPVSDLTDLNMPEVVRKYRELVFAYSCEEDDDDLET